MIWNSRIEKTLKILSIKAQAYSILHNRTASFSTTFDLFLGVTSGFITILSGSLITLPYFNPCNRSEEKTMIITSMLFFSAFVNFTQQFLSLKTKAIDNLKYSNKYHIISGDIKTQLSLYRSDRVMPTEFLNMNAAKLNRYIAEQPPINYIVKLYFFSKNSHRNLFIPEGGDIESLDVLSSLNSFASENDSEESSDNSNDGGELPEAEESVRSANSIHSNTDDDISLVVFNKLDKITKNKDFVINFPGE